MRQALSLSVLDSFVSLLCSNTLPSCDSFETGARQSGFSVAKENMIGKICITLFSKTAQSETKLTRL